MNCTGGPRRRREEEEGREGRVPISSTTNESEEREEPIQTKSNTSPGAEDTRIPDVLHCPITLSPFKDPVVVSSGQTYEREAIEDWMSHSDKDPVTGCDLKKDVYPNWAVRHTLSLLRSSSLVL